MTPARRAAAAVGLVLLGVLGWLVATDAGAPSGATPPIGAAAPPTGERVRVEVLNGGGKAGAARAATTFLRDAGYDVVQYGNASSWDHDSTRVVDRVGRPEIAGSVARALGIGNVGSEPDPNLYVDVTVVLGADWDREELPTSAPPPRPARAWWDPRGWLGR